MRRAVEDAILRALAAVAVLLVILRGLVAALTQGDPMIWELLKKILTSEPAQAVYVAAGGWLAARVSMLVHALLAKLAKDPRTKLLVQLAYEWYAAIRAKGDKEGWTDEERFNKFVEQVNLELGARKMRTLKPDEIGWIGQVVRRIHWEWEGRVGKSAPQMPAPLPAP